MNGWWIVAGVFAAIVIPVWVLAYAMCQVAGASDDEMQDW